VADFKCWLACWRDLTDFAFMSNASVPLPDPRQDRILAAARSHFAEHGFDRTKLADVAKAADVAVGTVYLRYPGKTELLVAVLQQAEQQFVEVLDDPVLRAIGWPDRFDVIFAAMIDRARADPVLPRLMALAPYAMSGGWRPGHAVRASILEHLEEGQKSGALRGDLNAVIAAAMAHGMVEGAMGLLFATPDIDMGSIVSHLAGASRNWLMA
jgi:AcrR family transcriptional regulator